MDTSHFRGIAFRWRDYIAVLALVPATLGALAAYAGGREAPPAQISPFGIGADSQTAQRLGVWIPKMADAGVRTLRSCRMGWGAVEPQQGHFAFEQLDQQLDLVARHGMVSGGLLLGTGAWNTKDRRGGLPLNSIGDWSNYVMQTVKHARGRVKYWEVWNEPPNFTNNAPPEDYAKIVVATYDAVKAADRNAKVGLAAKSVDVNYLDRAIRAGAKGHFDYVTLHPYETLGYVIDHPGAEPVFMNIARTVRAMLAALDPAKAGCPIWFTELGCDGKRKGADIQAQALVKAYAMGIAQGVECINWFEGIDGDSGPMGLLEAKGTPRPALTAMKQMTTHLGPYPEALGWVMLDRTNYGFAFKGAKGEVLIAWAPLGAAGEIDLDQPRTIVDPVTGASSEARTCKLTSSPVLILAPPTGLVAEARRNKDRPLTWGGDYSHARSVSVTYGDKTVEAGLRSRAGDKLKADVLSYGGAARAGNLTGGNAYMVDPTFMTYTMVPIEITAVVRRNPKNDTARLVVEYESTAGYKKLRPFEIPDNRQWHTATWRIDDAQFVGKYAYNFRFDLGKYYVKSVTVSKREQ